MRPVLELDTPARIAEVKTGAIVAHTTLTVEYGFETFDDNPVLYLHNGNNIVGAAILRPKSGTERLECEIKLPYNVPAGMSLTIVG